MASSKTQSLHDALSADAGAGDRDLPGSDEQFGDDCQFVHLHVHSAFSLLEGALTLKSLLELAVADNQPALAVTDRNNLFGALEFSEKAVEQGVQPIMGCKLAIDFEDGKDHQPRSGMVSLPFLVLLAQNETGFSNLRLLVSRAHLASEAKDPPHIKLTDLQAHAEGLICLTGGREGPLYRLSL
ncbi:MAG: PHP domain-containing protein, partial [Pseudomonadota bacterium]